MSEHNFIWTSKDVKNVPNQLLIGVEVVDGMIRVMNQNPDRDEYLMGETKANSAVDTSAVTADWFKATISTKDNYTFLNVIVADPAIYSDGNNHDASEFETSSNLQILDDGTRVELDMNIHKDLIDPELFAMMHRR